MLTTTPDPLQSPIVFTSIVLTPIITRAQSRMLPSGRGRPGYSTTLALSAALYPSLSISCHTRMLGHLVVAWAHLSLLRPNAIRRAAFRLGLGPTSPLMSLLLKTGIYQARPSSCPLPR
eukprot:7389005-Prymnesium_polylepis.1